jgi:phosphatidylserine decarboxylase
MAPPLPPDALAESVTWQFPRIHPQGRAYIVMAFAAMLLLYVFGSHWLGTLALIVMLWMVAFFRDPERVAPERTDALLAPADGLVTLIQRAKPSAELCGAEALGDTPLVRISIFMSVFDVHINRAPISGIIRRMSHVEGSFLNADHPEAAELNERLSYLIERHDGLRIGFAQVAGKVARRIVPFVKSGEEIAAGARVGLIRFGSRVDIYLPSEALCQIRLGQRTIAGETILATLPESPTSA